jgi:arylformamidase
MKIYDITRTITPTLAVWPGDTIFSFQHLARLSKGASVNLTTMTISAHTGTHADAPYHYTNSGAHPAQMPLEKYIGKAHVATISRRNGGIVPADFDGHNLAGMQRLLIHTWVSDLPDDQWAEDFPYPTPELIDWLASQGVVLMGVDMPSVDDFNSKTLDGHHRLLHHGIVNLETIVLKDVPDGVYELVALPLKIDGVCASPVRAILREI